MGSSRLLLQQGLTESLAGRFELIYMGHWSLTEMESAFGFSPAQFAWFGGYPGAAELISDENRWKKYIRDALIEPSILRDVLSLTRVDKPILLRRLFEFGEITANLEKWGRIVESAVGAHLINHARQSDFEVFYWREGNDEIDFVLKIRGKIIGIEVKSGTIRGMGGMEVFRKKFNPDKMLLMAPGVLSWEEFLSPCRNPPTLAFRPRRILQTKANCRVPRTKKQINSGYHAGLYPTIQWVMI